MIMNLNNTITKTLAIVLTTLLPSTFSIAADNRDPDSTLAEAAAFNATLYGYPMVALYDLFRTQLDQSDTMRHTGFSHDRKLADPDSRAIPAPNNDTLYSRGFFDLRHGPVILHIPPIVDRFYAFPIGDAFHNIVETFGSWNTGEEGARIALLGPDWTGPAPKADRSVRMPTNYGWILARVLVKGDQSDLSQVLQLQDQFRLERADSRGKPTAQPLFSNDLYPPASELANAERYFNTLNYMLSFNPFPERDQGMVESFQPIQVGPESEFDSDHKHQKSLISGYESAMAYMKKHSGDLGTKVNGWSAVSLEADMGTRYYYRAVINFIGLLHGDDTMQSAYTVFEDNNGEPLTGKQRYVIHFDSPPPVNAFWSLTMYNEEFFLVSNPINRYSLGDRTEGLKINPDGSLDIYLQHEPPTGEKSGNWLPTPQGSFWMGLRAYLPKETFLQRTWKPAAVTPLP